MKFRRTKAAEASDATTPVVDVRRPALRRSAAEETIDLVRGARATDRLRHGRDAVLNLDDAPANPRSELAAASDD